MKSFNYPVTIKILYEKRQKRRLMLLIFQNSTFHPVEYQKKKRLKM